MQPPKKNRSEPFAADDSAAARNKAIELLARREHSRRELTEKLTSRGFLAPTIAETLDALAAEGLQSEQRFVEGFVEQRVAKGYGALKIRAELHQRGASSELLAKALREAEIDWFAQAERALEKKWRAGVPADNAEQKGMRFLASRGFTGEQAREAICAVLAAAANNNTDSY